MNLDGSDITGAGRSDLQEEMHPVGQPRSEFSLLFTTVGDRTAAERLARKLVENRLAGCVQIDAITSVYRWDGKVERADEFRLTCKIRATDFRDVADYIKGSHAYDLPEIVMTPIEEGDQSYLDWLSRSTHKDAS